MPSTVSWEPGWREQLKYEQERYAVRRQRKEERKRQRQDERKSAIAHVLVSMVKYLLPVEHRERYIEEWRAELGDLPRLRRLQHLLGLLRSALVLAWQVRYAGPYWSQSFVQTIRIHSDYPIPALQPDSVLRILRLVPGVVVYRLTMVSRGGRVLHRTAVLLARLDGLDAAMDMMENWRTAVLDGEL
jgi:hypothetical protein